MPFSTVDLFHYRIVYYHRISERNARKSYHSRNAQSEKDFSIRGICTLRIANASEISFKVYSNELTLLQCGTHSIRSITSSIQLSLKKTFKPIHAHDNLKIKTAAFRDFFQCNSIFDQFPISGYCCR